MSERRLWATLQLGSRLYGTEVEGSDNDLLHLYIPTTVEMVDNRRVSLPQCIKDGVDTRAALLGDFVMSLGVNAEHSVLAYHYEEYFSDLQVYWMNGESLRRIVGVAENMWTNGKTPKNKAHAYRYVQAVNAMGKGAPLYPMLSQFHDEYMALRNDQPNQLTDVSFADQLAAVRSYLDRRWRSSSIPGRDRQARAEWVMLRYLGLAR